MRVVLLAAASIIILGGPAPMVRAESGGPRSPSAEEIEKARQAFRAGQSLMKVDRYAEAVVQFRRAHAITGDDLVMGQIALAYEKAGDYKAALRALQIYREAVPLADRRSVQRLMKRYRRRIEQGRSKPLSLPGGGTTDIAQEGAGSAERSAPGPGVVRQPNSQGQAPKAPEETAGPRSELYWTWIGAGVTGVLTVSALAVGLSARNKYDEVEGSGCKPNCDPNDVDSIRSRATAADVLWGTAATAAVATGALFLWEWTREAGPERAQAAGTRRPGASHAEGPAARATGLSITPVIGADLLGIAAAARY